MWFLSVVSVIPMLLIPRWKCFLSNCSSSYSVSPPFSVSSPPPFLSGGSEGLFLVFSLSVIQGSCFFSFGFLIRIIVISRAQYCNPTSDVTLSTSPLTISFKLPLPFSLNWYFPPSLSPSLSLPLTQSLPLALSHSNALPLCFPPLFLSLPLSLFPSASLSLFSIPCSFSPSFFLWDYWATDLLTSLQPWP